MNSSTPSLMQTQNVPPNFNLDAIRADFPILHQKIHGHPLVYLDNAASAQKPQCVMDAMHEMYRHSYANVHRGLHFLSNRATELYEQARETVRSFLNAACLDEIIFTKNATEAINLVAHSWGMPHIGKGDEIILTVMEHHANLVPWHFIRERQGAKLVFLPIGEDGTIHMQDFEQALSVRTRFVALTHMSNVLGTVPPVQDIVKRAHERGIPVLLDGAQAAVHMPIDVQALDCDFYVITGHKLYGPTGIGALYGKKELLQQMRPFQGGGEMIDTVTLEGIGYNAPPHRFEAGTPPIVEAVGLARALDYIKIIGFAAILHHEHQLTAYMRTRLHEVPDLRIFGDTEEKGGIFSFELAGIHAHDLAMFLDRQGVAVRAGTHCAQPLLNSFGVGATARASLAVYTSKEEIDQLGYALERAGGFFK